MNPKTDRWESYTDKAGRRHWRWPATDVPTQHDGHDAEGEPRPRAGSPLPQQTTFGALLARGK